MPANEYLNAVDLVFSCSCSGDNIFRHNLNLPTGPGTKYQVTGTPMLGDGYIKAIAANTLTIGGTTAASILRVRLIKCADYS